MIGCAWIEGEGEEGLAELLTCLESVTPDMEVGGEGRVFFACSGFPEGAQVVEALGNRVRVGVGRSRFVAQMAASARGRCVLVAPTDEEAFLACLPLARLPLEPSMLRRLTLLGLKTAAEVAALPAQAVTAQFGLEGERLLQWLTLGDRLPLQTLSPQPVYGVDHEFEAPLADGQLLFEALRHHLGPLMERLRKEQKRCTALAFRFAEFGFRVGFASPVNELERVEGPVRERLARLTFPKPVEGFQVVADGVVAEYARQLNFAWEGGKRQHIQRVVERLEMRGSALWQVHWLDPNNRLPERRACLQQVDREKHRGLLLPKPARVVTGADGIPRLVRTRSGWQAVEMLVDSWELEDEWWHARPLMRFYYRVLLKNGGIYRLFRDGLDGRWYRQAR